MTADPRVALRQAGVTSVYDSHCDGAHRAVPLDGHFGVALWGANTMDLRALWETLVAVGITPVASIAMALIVLAGIVVIFRKTYRR